MRSRPCHPPRCLVIAAVTRENAVAGVSVDNHHPRLRVDRRGLERHLRDALKRLGRAGSWVDVQLVDDATIRELNAQWRHRDEVTDVLSFALQDDPDDVTPVPVLGDIVISLDTAYRQAAAMRTHLVALRASHKYRLRDEVFFLATHGLLHLLGYDHQSADDASEMEQLERRLIESFCSVDVHDLDRSDHGLHLDD
ncbi:MAG TPA: rRNA maturation RNase YbeY [Myxococcales bacterium]|nr:rRNA maturation RNase YbeY [Myxococcales bacterium]